MVRQFYAWSRTYEKLETHALEAEVGTCGRGMELGVRRIFVFVIFVFFFLPAVEVWSGVRGGFFFPPSLDIGLFHFVFTFF